MERVRGYVVDAFEDAEDANVPHEALDARRAHVAGATEYLQRLVDTIPR